MGNRRQLFCRRGCGEWLCSVEASQCRVGRSWGQWEGLRSRSLPVFCLLRGCFCWHPLPFLLSQVISAQREGDGALFAFHLSGCSQQLVEGGRAIWWSYVVFIIDLDIFPSFFFFVFLTVQEPSNKRVKPLSRVTSLANLIPPVKATPLKRFSQTLQVRRMQWARVCRKLSCAGGDIPVLPRTSPGFRLTWRNAYFSRRPSEGSARKKEVFLSFALKFLWASYGNQPVMWAGEQESLVA